MIIDKEQQDTPKEFSRDARKEILARWEKMKLLDGFSNSNERKMELAIIYERLTEFMISIPDTYSAHVFSVVAFPVARRAAGTLSTEDIKLVTPTLIYKAFNACGGAKPVEDMNDVCGEDSLVADMVDFVLDNLGN